MKKSKKTLKEPQWLVILILIGLVVYFVSDRSLKHYQTKPIAVSVATSSGGSSKNQIQVAKSTGSYKHHRINNHNEKFPPGTMPP